MARIAAASAAVTPLVGLLGDRWGRRRTALAGTAAMGLVIFPYTGLLASGSPAAITVGSLAELLAFITAFAVLGAYLPELYAPRVRCTGAALGNLGGILGGALTPIAATRPAEGGGTPWPAAVYVAAVALLSLGCFAALPDTREDAAADTTAGCAAARRAPRPG
jgi:MFS family permease